MLVLECKFTNPDNFTGLKANSFDWSPFHACHDIAYDSGRKREGERTSREGRHTEIKTERETERETERKERQNTCRTHFLSGIIFLNKG